MTLYVVKVTGHHRPVQVECIWNHWILKSSDKAWQIKNSNQHGLIIVTLLYLEDVTSLQGAAPGTLQIDLWFLK